MALQDYCLWPMLSEYEPAIVEFRLEAEQTCSGKWNGQLYDAHSSKWTGACYTQSSTAEEVHQYALRTAHNIVRFKAIPYLEPNVVTPHYPIAFLEKSNPKVEDQLQNIGLGFASALKSEKDASNTSKKMERLRLLGAVVAGGSLLSFLGHLFPLLQAPANLPVLLVSCITCLLGYLLMESASRSLRILQLLSRNKPLQQKFALLASQSAAVQSHQAARQSQGRPLRTYDVAQANHLRIKELNEIQ